MSAIGAGTPNRVSAATPPTLYAYEPQDNGNCLAPCTNLTVWVQPGTASLDLATASLSLVDTTSGAAVPTVAAPAGSDTFTGVSTPVSRFVFATPGLLAGHVYKAAFAIRDAAASALSMSYQFLVNRISVPVAKVSIARQEASSLAQQFSVSGGATTRVTFAHLPVTVPSYPVHISGSRHAGLGYTMQAVSLTGATITYTAGGVSSTIPASTPSIQVDPSALQTRPFYQQINVIDPSRTDYDLYAVGGQYDAGPVSLDLPGNVTAASISMASVPTISVAGALPGLMPVVPVHGSNASVDHCPIQVTTDGYVDVCGIGLGAVGVVDELPIYSDTATAAAMVGVQENMAQRLSLHVNAANIQATAAQVVSYPELCSINSGGKAYDCQPQVNDATVPNLYNPCPTKDCAPNPQAALAPPSSQVFQQSDLSSLCGASLACADPSSGVRASGQSSTTQACSDPNNTQYEGQCAGQLDVTVWWTTYIDSPRSGYHCGWPDDNGNPVDCEYVFASGGWADPGYANSGPDTNANGTNDGFQLQVGEKNTNGQTLYDMNWAWNELEASRTFGSGCTPYGDTHTETSGNVQWRGVSGDTTTAIIDLKFNEEWWGGDYCGYQATGGDIGDTWLLPNPGCQSPNPDGSGCSDPMAVTYDQVVQDCGWHWSLGAGFPKSVSVALDQSCTLRDNRSYFQVAYQH